MNMNTNIISAETEAITKLEAIFKAAGWADGWNLTDAEVRKSDKPLFYRNSSSSVATEAKVSFATGTHTLYCIYRLIDTVTNYSENHPHNFAITIALTFYYDDAFIFLDAGENPFTKLLLDVIEGLDNEEWAVNQEAEESVTSADNANTFLNRKILFATNIF
jgi:hypothetical protein